jgi:hypothetical protein
MILPQRRLFTAASGSGYWERICAPLYLPLKIFGGLANDYLLSVESKLGLCGSGARPGFFRVPVGFSPPCLLDGPRAH